MPALEPVPLDNGEHELYDLMRDPEERDNLAGRRDSDIARSHQALEQWGDRTRPLDPASRRPAMGLETLKRLRELGYLR